MNGESTVWNLHVLQHVPFEGPGVLPEWGWDRGRTVLRHRWYLNEHPPDPDGMDGVVVTGGPMGWNEESRYPWLREEKRLLENLVERGTPVLGICLGAQLLAEVFGADVRKAPQPEIGWFPVTLTSEAASFSPTADWPENPEVLHWHRDTFEVPDEGELLAVSESGLNQAFVVDERFVGLQFHLEMRSSDVERLLYNRPRGELPDEKEWVQSPETIRAGSRRAGDLHGLLYGFLDDFFDAASREPA